MRVPTFATLALVSFGMFASSALAAPSPSGTPPVVLSESTKNEIRDYCRAFDYYPREIVTSLKTFRSYSTKELVPGLMPSAVNGYSATVDTQAQCAWYLFQEDREWLSENNSNLVQFLEAIR
ncbi:hypothetical protein IWQ62_000644 [Dispira parvispora]|uniref:Uncharacterized protein n=1 Tax=Dispira parvispora TaxID=1520584 RepID=A0A9W8AWN0_9FUNG|nr:hypothetical protein IWQ62_000644 [Dispira parvispora]